MKRKRIVALMLAVMMSLNTVMPAYATENEINESAEMNNFIEIDDSVKMDDSSEVNETEESNSIETEQLLNEDNFIATGTYGENIEWTLDSEGVLSISGSGEMPHLYDVYKQGWSDYLGDIKKVIISEGITSIGGYAFAGCFYLECVELPKGIIKIEENAFRYCEALREISLPNEVTSIGDYAFEGCIELTSVGKSESLVEIGAYSFYSCNKLSSVYFPNSLERIGKHAFLCSGVQNIVLPDGITRIEENTFASCVNLTSIRLPNTLTYIGAGAFEDCESLESLVLPNGLESIEAYTFKNCSALQQVVLSDDITTIGQYSFQNCSALKTIDFPDTLVTIEKYAFENSGIETLNIKNTIETIGEKAFYRCSQLHSLVFDCGVENFSLDIFAECINLKNVSMTGDITYAQTGLFERCSSIETVTVPEGTSELIFTFSGCRSLKNVVLPESMMAILEYAFSECSNLESIYIPSAVEYIDVTSFENCAENFTIRCYKNSHAHTFAIENEIPYQLIKEYVATGVCGDNATWTLDEDGVLEISGTGDMYETGIHFNNIRDKVRVVIVNEGITSVNINTSTYIASNVESVSLPEGLKKIGPLSFFFFKKLTSIQLPESLEEIGDEAFCGSGITEIQLPKNIITLGADCFNGSALESITIPENITKIPARAFAHCQELKTVNFPETLTSIGESGFLNCTSLTEVSIPKGVTNVGAKAFASCTSLEKINCYYGTAAYRYAMNNKIDVHAYEYKLALHDNKGVCGEPIILECYYGKPVLLWDSITLLNEISSQFGRINEDLYYGYDITKWTTASNGTGGSYLLGESFDPILGNDGDTIHLYAQWQEKSFYINYHLDGGINASSNPAYYKINQNFVLANPEKPYYEFAGWYRDKDFKFDQIYEVYFRETDIITDLYAKWIPIEYEIAYELDGGAFEENIKTSYNVEDAAIVLSIPIKKGYQFEGWYDNAQFEGHSVSEISAGSNGRKCFYAKWSKIGYTINYYLNGGENHADNPKGFDVFSSLTIKNATRIGYVFEGWYRNPEFTGEKIENIPVGTTENIELYAKWSKIEYQISYDLGEGTFTETVPTVYTIEETIVLLPPLKSGYQFEGWYDNAQFEGDSITEIYAGSTGDKKFYAKWSKIDYTITYHLNDGENHVDNPMGFDVHQMVVVKDALRNGYTFKGWYRNEDFTGAKVTTIPEGTTESIELYAKWEIIYYTINYDVCGGEISNNAVKSFTIHDEVELEIPTRSYYTFDGWYIDASYEGNPIEKVEKGSTGSYNFYAKWTPNRYKITYHLNGGVNHPNNTASSYTYEDHIKLSDPSRTGYVFEGWYEDEDFTSSKVIELPNHIVDSKELYANWSVINYSILYELNGGEGDLNNPSSYTVEDSFVFENPTRIGYEFVGWSDSENNPVKELCSGTIGNQTFSANWEIIHYPIRYELNGGELIESAEKTYTINDYVSLESPTREGYYFEGWYDNAEFEGERIYSIPSHQTGEKCFYAKWSAKTYQIFYILGSSDAVNSETNLDSFNADDVLAGILLEEPTWKNHKFEGWYESSDFTGEPIDKITEYKRTWLYAKWSLDIDEFTVELPVTELIYDYTGYGWENDVELEIHPNIFPEDFPLEDYILRYSIFDSEDREVITEGYCSDNRIYLYTSEIKAGTYRLVLYIYDYYSESYAYAEPEAFTISFERREYPINQNIILDIEKQDSNKLVFADVYDEVKSLLEVDNIEETLYLDVGEEKSEGTIYIKDINGNIIDDQTKVTSGSYVAVFKLDNPGATFFEEVETELTVFETGIQESNGKYYLYGEDGTLLKGYINQKDYRYYSDQNGVLQTGWIKIGDDWHYFDRNHFFEINNESQDGYLYRLENGDISYFTNKTTLLKNSWQTHAGYRYYFDENGFAKQGWFEDGKYEYYAETVDTATEASPVGNVVNGVKIIGGKIYGFHTSQYYRLTGWQTVGTDRYFFKEQGDAVVGWYQEGDYWYYAKEDGKIAKGLTEIEDKTYYFDTNYRLTTGWVKIDNVWRFFDDAENHRDRYEINCVKENGWLTLQEESARKSYVDAKNNLLKGWQTISGNRYYFDSNGIMETGWFQVGNYHYYADEDGIVAKGLKTIDEETYVFHASNYYRLTGWQTVSGKRFYLNTDGKAETGLFEVGGKTYLAETQNDSQNNLVKGQIVIGVRNTEDGIRIFHTSQYYMLTGWQSAGGQRYYIKDDGTAIVNQWYQEGDYWYHADENGYMAKGLVVIDGKEYYFDNNYRLSAGWKNINGTMYFFDSVAEDPAKCHALDYEGAPGSWIILSDKRKSYINAKNQVLTGWQTINGKRYYFSDSGIMETGLFQVGRYYYYAQVEKDATSDSPEGCIATGAKTIDGKTYGFHTSQYYRLTGWQTLNGQKYYFQDDCSAVTSWYQEGDYWYYADAEGRMQKGPAEIEGKIYYFDGNYRLATGWVKLDNVWRFFDNAESHLERYELSYTQENGWMTLQEESARKSYVDAKNNLLKGWQTISGNRYYFDSNGIMEIGEFKVGNYYYYADADGTVAKGIKVIDGETYCFHASSYYRLTGWQTVSGKRFFLDSEGKAATGLFENGGRKYYAETITDSENDVLRGAVVTGRKKVGDITYVFHPSQYYMLTGWQTVNGQRYFINEDGSAVVNQWYQEGDYWYHADENGYMAKGLVTIEGKEYYFDNNYRLSTGWKRIGNEMYFFDLVAEAPEKCYAVDYEGTVGDWFALADGRKSYINTKYQVLTGWQTINGKRYYFDGTGIMETGLFQVGRYYYYAEIKENATADSPEGSIAVGAKLIDGKIYGFHPSQYYRLTGWQTLNGQRYYFQDDCSAVVGWYQDGNYWYYANGAGEIQKGEVTLVTSEEERIYYFDSNYRLTTGWIKLNNVWRYFKSSDNQVECCEVPSDQAISGWITLNTNQKSYIHTKNGILKGWQTIDGQRYYFDNAGIMQTGWFELSGYWYYANEEGGAAKGAQVIGEKTYYFDGNYRLTTGWVKVDNVWRFFDNAEDHLEKCEVIYTAENGWLTLKDLTARKSYVDGKNNLLKGWQTISGNRYYFDSLGIMETDWFQVGSYWYYADADGVVAKNAVEIDGKTYGFHATQYYRLSGWQTLNGQRYRFQDTDYSAVTGWYQEGDYWYYADANGCMAKDLTLIEGKEYYFDTNYRLSTGWKRVGNEMYFFDFVAETPEKCHAVTYEGSVGGWMTLSDGRKSYINTKYQVLTGWQTINGKRYYFDGTGIMETGLFQVGRYYYYAEVKENATADSPEGSMAVGAKLINGKVYGFHTSQYYRLTGWQTLNGQRYYFQDDCSAVIGWYQDSGYWYYADANGCMAKGEVKIGDYNYYFDSNYRLTTGWVKLNGVWRFFYSAENYLERHELSYTEENGWLTLKNGEKSYVHTKNGILKGWQTISGNRYYFDNTGIMQTGEFKVGNYFYYADSDGIVAKGIKVIDGETYCFHTSSYYRLTGWQTVSGKRFFLDSEGKAVTGLFETGGRKYYAETETNPETDVLKGTVVTGQKKVGENIYVFHTSQYYMLTGWQTVNGQRYFLKADGSAVANQWYQEGDYWYYADENGAMAKGLVTIQGKQYYFDANYRLSTGWKRIGNEMYFFDLVAERPSECHAVDYEGVVGGWITLSDGRKSYINAKYQVLTGWQTISGQRYYFDEKGIALTGEFQVGRYHYYAETSGELQGVVAKNAVEINGKIYGFHPSQYYRLTGWQTLNGQRYYFKDDCSAVTGWYQEGDYWYYAKSDGSMLKGEQQLSENGEYYYFDGNYRLASGWIKVGSEWKFFDNAENPKQRYRLDDMKDGSWATLEGGRRSYIHSKNGILKGWQTISNQRYYFDSVGIMQTGWFEVSGYWHYATEDGIVLKGLQTEILHAASGEKKTYYFDSNYRLKTGWQTINGVRYHFAGTENPAECYAVYSGAVSKGWFVFEGKKSYFNSSLNPVTGWQTIENKKYYFDTNGIMQTGWFQVGAYWYYAYTTGVVASGTLNLKVGEETKTYYFDDNLRLQLGWKNISGKKYYIEISGTPENYKITCVGIVGAGWHTMEDGNVFYTDSAGNVKTGWQTIDKQRYYFNASGMLKTGWFTVSGKTYYADDDGIVAKGVKIIDEETYVFHSSQYYMLTGFQSYGGNRYYLQPDGKAKTGWFAVGTDRYYGGEAGVLASGAKEIGGETYFFHTSSNYRLTGWQSTGGKRYYLDTDGTAKTGWFEVGGKIYYGEPATSGEILKGTLGAGAKEISGKTYFFHTSSNYRMTGWQTTNGQRYYLNIDGTAKTGWFEVGGKIYYADPIVAKGLKQIGEETYYFHTSSYYRLTGWQTINKQRYYFDTDGAMALGWFEVGGYYYYADTKEGTKGIVLKGLQEIGENKLYYFDSNYRLKTGWQTIDNKKYFFENAKKPEDCYKTNDGNVIDAGWFELENGQICYADSKGNVKTGWQTIDKQRYYFDANGVLLTGWFSLSNKQYYADSDGVVAKGNKTIDGKTYCFHTSSYYMLTGWQTINGQRYYLEADGSAKTGWFEVSGKTYYADSDGVVAKGAVTVGENTYVFHSSQYYMLTGFQSYNGKRYYLQKDGTAKTGWFTVGSDLYYGNPTEQDGVLKGLLASGAKEIGGETYFFHTSSNYRLTGWQTVSGQRYYMGADGKATTGWFTVSGKIYYGEPATTDTVLKGTVAKGVKVIDGKTYCFHTNSYYRLTGWQTINKQRFYLQSDGSAITGWFTVSGKTYYAEPKAKDGEIQEVPVGVVATGAKTIDGKTYVFHTSQYYRLTGWQTVSGQRYYLETDGSAKTGWFEVGGKTYYADSEGIVAKGSKAIGDDTYVFHSSQYYMLTGFQSYGGKRYYLQKDGTAKTGWFTVGSDLYYGNPTEQDGILKGTLASGAKEIGGETYFFHTSSNYRLTGWQTVSGQRYYLETDGTARTGWFTISGKIYYAEPVTTDSVLKGTVAKGVKEIAGKTYCFHTSNYYRLTGWQTISGQRYYLDKDGVAKTGWFTVSGKKYYADPVVAKGLAKVEGKTYYFHTSQYHMLTGWQTINKERYYFDTDGSAKTGWFTIGGYHYYANPDGIIAKGLAELPYGTEGQKKTYYFDSNYRLKTGWQIVGGKKYFFENAVTPEECYATIATYDIRTGWFELENGQICYADSKGNIKTGWQTIEKQRYYFDANGVLLTGWFSVSNKQYYADSDGVVAKGVKIIENQTYVFHSSQYYMLTGWQTMSGQRYYLDTDGSATTGWFTISGKNYYAGTDGVVSKGAVTIGKDTYVFHSSQYYMLTGFQSYSGKRYYLQKDGTAKTGWFTVGSDLYYGNPTEQDGILKGTLASGAKEIDGETYFFHASSNYRVTGWQTVNGQRYYLDTDGSARTGWFTISGKIYYGEPSTTDTTLKGTLAKGVKEINGKIYVFHTSNYYRLTGWQTVSGQRYYLNTDGTAKTGWFTVSGKKYCADPIVAKGLVMIDGKGYYFHTSQYYMLTGFHTINKERYYFNANGIMETGWFETGGYAYCANQNGTLVKGLAELPYGTDGGNKYYYFDSNYRQKTGWQTVNGKKYFFAHAAIPEECYATYEGMSGAGWIEMGNDQLSYADSKGNIKTGWQTIAGNRYYFNAKGILQTDWFTVGKYHYYAEPKVKNGEKQEIPIGVVAKGIKVINKETYCFHTSNYYMLTGWQTVGGQRFYLESDGTARTGWFTISGKTYYGEPTSLEDGTLKGSIAKGAKEIGGETYVFHSTDYSRLTGWQTVGIRKYYLQANGRAKTGWFKQNGYWYYGSEVSIKNEPKGTMEKAMRTIGEHTYYFDTNYRLSTGWKVVNGIKYFFNVDENPENCYLIYQGLTNRGWFELENGSKSYFDSKGNAVTGWQTIDGKKYYFDASGIMQTGWITISGVEYFFNTEGIYIPMTAPGITSLTSTSYETVDVKWNLVDGIQSYILEYSTNNVFPSWETVRVEFTDTTICEYRAEHLEGDTTYYFRLRYTTWSDDSENANLYYSQYSTVKSISVRGEVAPTSTSAAISECQITSGSRNTGITVQMKATLKDRIKSVDDQYYIVETESYGTAIDLATPVGSVDKDFEIDAEFVIDAGDGSDNVRESVDRALMNKFALAILKDDGSYQVISTPMGITNPETISENTDDIFRAISKKGIQGIYYASDTNYGMLNAKDQNSKQTLINMNIEDLVGTAGNSGYQEYVYKGKTYYFSKCEAEIANIKSLNAGYDEYMHYYSDKESGGRKVKVCVTVNLLLGYESADAYLIDPAARRSGYRYYTLNVREEKARETYEALFFYLGEIFGQEDCYVTNWILGNEVNSSRAWNYQGSLSQDAYMQVYAAAFRLLYNGVKAAKSGNNVYISLDNGWTAAPDTYSGKSILDKFALYAQNENPDMKWSIAYHGYSYPLTKCDFWNDSSNTTFSTSTRYISMKNISVLTNYAAALEEKYDKPEGSIRIILSEQGYNAGQGAEIQAQALARGYYMAEFNDRIDAFIIRAVIDDADEMRGGLYLGIRSWDEKKRISFYVYEFMDSCLEDFEDTAPSKVASSTTNQNKVKTAKKILCDTDWESLVPGFSRSKLAGMY